MVVGASLAGVRAVESARRAGYTGAITLVGEEPHSPYDRPPLSKAFLAPRAPGAEPPAHTALLHPDALRDEHGVDLRLGERATGLDLAARRVLVGADAVPYDAVVIATGSTARRIPGTEGLAGVHVLRTLDDAVAVRTALEAASRVVVIGAGFIGSELASNARARGLDVTVVEALPTPLSRAVGVPMGHAIAALHERNGTRLLLGDGVDRIEGHDRVERVVLASGRVLPADLVVAGIGIQPAVDWLAGSGLELDNGVVADAALRAAEGVFVAGDVANWPNAALDERQRLENWTSAAAQGMAAGRNAVSGDPSTFATVPYFWSDWYGSRIQFVGSPVHDETVVVEGVPEDGGRWVALYRRGNRLIGALTLDAPADIMKYRALIGSRGTWQDGLDLAAQRRAAREA